MNYIVYVRRVFGPIGPQQDWRLKFVRVGTVTAEDEVAAAAIAKALGWPAPVVGVAQ